MTSGNSISIFSRRRFSEEQRDYYRGVRFFKTIENNNLGLDPCWENPKPEKQKKNVEECKIPETQNAKLPKISIQTSKTNTNQISLTCENLSIPPTYGFRGCLRRMPFPTKLFEKVTFYRSMGGRCHIGLFLQRFMVHHFHGFRWIWLDCRFQIINFHSFGFIPVILMYSRTPDNFR